MIYESEDKMTKVKICGLKTLDDIKSVNQYLPDYIGFVFATSKRQITISQAELLKRYLNTSIKVVGVFVNEPENTIISLCKEKIIDVIQLHGQEDEKYLYNLRAKVNNPIIKAIGVNNEIRLRRVNTDLVDYYLFDTITKGHFGGSGITFDHSMLKDVLRNIKIPFFLAGGLHSSNVAQAISDFQPYCVDVSSGVEKEGKKDDEKIKEFINIVRSM